MASIPVKYIVTKSDAMDNIPIVDGQVICLSDRDGWFYDMGNSRREASGDKYAFQDSDTIEIKMDELEDKKINWSAEVKDHSIGEQQLEEGYLSEIKAQSNRAVQAANASEAAASRSAASAVTSAGHAEDSEESAEESSQFASNASGYANDASGFANAANQSAQNASSYANHASSKATEASGYARESATSADESEDSALESQSWATGGTGTREGEDTNNAKYYAELARQAAQSLSGSLVPKGTIMFEQLADIVEPLTGWMYNIANDFVTDDTFLTANVYQKAGTNVFYTDSGKWDSMVGSNVTGVKGNAETNYRTGNVNITKQDIGLDKVPNMTAADILNLIKIVTAGNQGAPVGTITINDIEYVLRSPLEVVYMTAAEYALLSEEDKMKDVLYGITDDNSGSIINDEILSKEKTWSSQKIQEAIKTTASDEKVAITKSTAKAFLMGTTTAPTNDEQTVKSVADESIYFGETEGELNVGSLNATGEIHAGAVYSAVWNDFAEWFEKENEYEEFEPGTIVAWSHNGVVKASEDNKYMVAGVCSDSFGYIVGGEDLQDMKENHKKFVPVGLVGRVKVKVVGQVSRGDFIVPLTDGIGIAVKPGNYTHGTTVGKAIESKYDTETGYVKIIIMLA